MNLHCSMEGWLRASLLFGFSAFSFLDVKHRLDMTGLRCTKFIILGNRHSESTNVQDSDHTLFRDTGSLVGRTWKETLLQACNLEQITV